MRGLLTVFNKELADYFISWRGVILFAVVLLTAVFAIYGPSGAIQNIRDSISSGSQLGSTQFVFLRLFTTSGQGSQSFLYFISAFLLPVIGIALGFDAINSEKNNGTMSRLLSQPIHRDTVFNEPDWWHHPPVIPDRLPGLDEALRNGISLPRFTKPVPELIEQYVQAFEKVWAHRAELGKT